MSGRRPDAGSGAVARASAAGSSPGAPAAMIPLPKCPLCIVAALSMIGVGVTAGAASLARPGLVLAAAAAAIVFAWLTLRRRARDPACAACTPGLRGEETREPHVHDDREEHERKQ